MGLPDFGLKRTCNQAMWNVIKGILLCIFIFQRMRKG